MKRSEKIVVGLALIFLVGKSFQQQKAVAKAIEVLEESVDLMDEIIQSDIDVKFADIVENYDD